ncbi:unnamed protein product [Rhizophagus irregularis]|uniref:Uncharacterized protein n=1 Tax=Rhizophagus irregularis TaxID=588596 RepID=A0A916EFF4_9GLOM|nr:unnamed protein product [Rhizophagus irregularis]
MSKYNSIQKQAIFVITIIVLLMYFTVFIRWFNNHGLEQGFTFIITHSEKDKEDSLPRRHTYYCMRGRRYVPQKEAQINDERDTGHHMGDCKFYINTYR